MADRPADSGPTHEREITSRVDLCLPDGRLNPDAVGWTRQPLHRANLRGWGRNKRFEYWCVTTPTHLVAVNVSHADYRVTYAAFFLDFATDRTVQIAERSMLPLGTPMPLTSGEGGVRARGAASRWASTRLRPGPGCAPGRPGSRWTCWWTGRRGTSRWGWWCRGTTGCSSTPARTTACGRRAGWWPTVRRTSSIRTRRTPRWTTVGAAGRTRSSGTGVRPAVAAAAGRSGCSSVASGRWAPG